MRFREYGADKKDSILLLHGGGLSWWNYREAAELLQEEYHIILPILDGHAGSDRPFTTIEENASEIISFIDEQLGGSALLIGGLSLGGQILLEMLSRRRDLCPDRPGLRQQLRTDREQGVCQAAIPIPAHEAGAF